MTETYPIFPDDPLYGFAEREIGQISLLWNRIHFVVFAYFVGFTGLSAGAAAAAFYSLKADSAQREMTRALGLHVIANHTDDAVQPLGAKFKSSLVAIDKYAGKRNAIIHGHWWVNEEGKVILSPHYPVSPTSPKHEIFRRFPEVIAELSRLDREVRSTFDQVAVALAWPETLLAT